MTPERHKIPMKTTHCIVINENPRLDSPNAVRVSSTRQYGACVVATVTAQTIAWVEAQVAEHEAEVKRLQPLVDAALQAIGGISYAEAKAAHKLLESPWWPALFLNEKQLMRSGHCGLSNAQKAEAVRRTVAQGLTNPYDHPLWTYLQLIHSLDNHTARAARYRWQEVKEGQQLVLGWHRDEAMAQKGLGRHKWYVSMGYALTVRTDIEITATE